MRRILRRAMCAAIHLGLPQDALSRVLLDVVISDIPVDIYGEVK